MIRHDFYGVDTVLHCFMQTFGTTNTIKIDLFTLCTSLLGGHSFKTFNECSLATKTVLRPGNYPGHSRGGRGLFVKNLVRRFRKRKLLPPLPSMPLQSSKGQLYLLQQPLQAAVWFSVTQNIRVS